MKTRHPIDRAITDLASVRLRLEDLADAMEGGFNAAEVRSLARLVELIQKNLYESKEKS